MHLIQNGKNLFSLVNNLNPPTRVLVHLLLAHVMMVAIFPPQVCTVFLPRALRCDKEGYT
jgi:hypothetical protein